jgi:integrase
MGLNAARLSQCLAPATGIAVQLRTTRGVCGGIPGTWGYRVLTELAVKAAKPREKPYKLFDERGLYLLVSPTGARLWRFKYRQDRTERLLTFGAHPEVSLKRARDKRDEARRKIAEGVDPRRLDANGETFEDVAWEWLEKQKNLAESTRKRDRERLENFIFPRLGRKPVGSVTAQDLLAELRKIEARGTHETAHRTRAVVGRVLRYAIATGRAKADVSAHLIGALTSPKPTSYPAITEPRRIGELLRAIAGYVGQPSTEYALKLAPYVFVRPGELRHARWSEFNLPAAEWRIPASRMKAGREHIVPLATQVVSLLQSLRDLTDDYLFPSLRTTTRPISEVTLNAALRRMGFTKDEMTPHGFRSMASTRLNEQGFPPADIELQLAHMDKDQVRAAYNRSLRLDERRKMMQWWADYLDGLRVA